MKFSFVLAAMVAQSPPALLPPTLTGPNFGNEARQSMQRASAEMLLLAAADSSLPVIPLSDASPRFGFVLNDFLFTRAEIIRAANAGRPMSAEEIIMLRRSRLIHAAVVAFPIRCGTAEVKPLAIEVLPRRGTKKGPLPPDGEPWNGGTEIARHIGGAEIPNGAIAQAFIGSVEDSTVRVTYDAPACPSTQRTQAFEFSFRSGEADSDGSAIAQLPPGSAVPWPAKVRVSIFIDARGLPRLPVVVDGPSSLAQAALAHVMNFRFRPYRVNSTPIIAPAVLSLTFVGEGKPTARRLTVADLKPPPLGFTEDIPRLSLSNSRCPAAESGTFGMNEEEAIQIGGGANAPQRERAYLENLRGPQGEGIFFTQPRPAKGPSGAELHLYGVTYDRLGIWIALIFDPSTTAPGPILSPQGFACAGPFAIR